MSGDPQEGPLVGSTKAVRLPQGRGQFVTRKKGAQLVQVGYLK
jgi:S-DNA-T family DNA segregation ATPase FtsK/SpoIIIE